MGFERVVGSIHGRRGSFVLHHSATSSPEGRSATWSVVPDTGTGGLLGLRGEAEISVEPDGGHSSSLDYDLGNPRPHGGSAGSGCRDQGAPTPPGPL